MSTSSGRLRLNDKGPKKRGSSVVTTGGKGSKKSKSQAPKDDPPDDDDQPSDEDIKLDLAVLDENTNCGKCGVAFRSVMK